jgi:hypothetical protein
MRRRDHPQIGDLWANSDKSVVFTVLDKERDESGWMLTILVGGNADGDEGQIKNAYMDEDFSKLDGVYWRIT